MKRTILVTSLTALGLAFGASNALADFDQPWHVTAGAGSMVLDSNRNTREDDVWLSVGFGRFLSPNFSLDIEYDEFSGTWRDAGSVVPGATYDQWKLSTWGLMGRYYFTDWNLRPYLAFGAGQTKHRNVSEEDRATQTSLGLGIEGKLSKHVSARVQGLWRRDYDRRGSIQEYTDFDDFIWNVGVSINFGGKEPPPPPPPPPPPEKPPPPDPEDEPGGEEADEMAAGKERLKLSPR